VGVVWSEISSIHHSCQPGPRCSLVGSESSKSRRAQPPFRFWLLARVMLSTRFHTASRTANVFWWRIDIHVVLTPKWPLTRELTGTVVVLPFGILTRRIFWCRKDYLPIRGCVLEYYGVLRTEYYSLSTLLQYKI
jgi:hypothetical protein